MGGTFDKHKDKLAGFGVGQFLGGAPGGIVGAASGLSGGLGGLIGDAFEGPSSELQTQQFPGVFGTPEGARIAGGLEALLGRGVSAQPYSATPFAPSQAQGQILSSLLDLVGGQTAAKGLGVPTEGARLEAVAPTFAGFAGQEAQRGLQARGQDIQQLLGQRGQTIQGLLELAGLAMPQIVGGQKEEAGGLGRDILGGLAAGIPGLIGKCWVADSLYGVGSPKAMQARLYANSHDTLFLRIYGRYGEGWAKWLDNHSWAKPLVRPIWDYMAYKGRKMEVSHG